MSRDPVVGVLSRELFKLNSFKDTQVSNYTSVEIEERAALSNRLLNDCQQGHSELDRRVEDDALFSSELRRNSGLIYRWQLPLQNLLSPAYSSAECGLDDLSNLSKDVSNSPLLSHTTLMTELAVCTELNQGIRKRYTNYLERSVPKEPRYLKTTTTCIMKRQSKYKP